MLSQDERRKNRRTPLMRRVEEQFGKSLPDLLRERHRVLGNYVLVAEELGVPAATVYYWFRKFDVPLSQFMVPTESDTDQVPA
jgi:hypothetical protein